MDVSEISDFFSNFYKSDFLIFTYSQIRKLECLKSKISKHPSVRYLPMVKYDNSELSITWRIFQYMTYGGHATCFFLEGGGEGNCAQYPDF